MSFTQVPGSCNRGVKEREQATGSASRPSPQLGCPLAIGAFVEGGLSLLHPLCEAEVLIPRCENPRLRCRLSECADKERHLRGCLDVRRFEDVQVVAWPEHSVICQPFDTGTFLLYLLLDFAVEVGNSGRWRQGLGRKSGQHRIGSHRYLPFPAP